MTEYTEVIELMEAFNILDDTLRYHKSEVLDLARQKTLELKALMQWQFGPGFKELPIYAKNWRDGQID